ncbi:hypothetical protein [Patulibacter minatonensis]|uniref:hypothetical protein n=1 Tax=Patulibacter minatonensis TaxID=298163 RepID=UPI00047C8414|nr:hypothetical protein [Patulibacter minatonensis]
MSPRRHRTHRRGLLAVSVLSAGAVAAAGPAAAVASAAAPSPAAVPASIVLVDLDPLIATLQSGPLGQLLTGLTGIQVGDLVDGTAVHRLLVAVTTIATPQLTQLSDALGQVLKDGLPAPLGVTVQTVLRTITNVLVDRGVQIPTQTQNLLADPPKPLATAPAPDPVTVMRARIADATPARDGRSARLSVSCPVVSDTACRVTVTTTLGGRRAGAPVRATIARGRTTAITPRLTSAVSRRLASRGGTLRMTVRTTGSPRGPLSVAVPFRGSAASR